VPLESLLALQAAKMVGFAFIGDFELGCVFVQNHAADRVSKHLLCPVPQERMAYPPFMVSGLKKHHLKDSSLFAEEGCGTSPPVLYLF